MNPDLPILTPQEEQLEQELRSYVPRVPSLDLKARIRAAAAEMGVQPEAPPVPPIEPKKIARFPMAQAWISAAALLVAGVFGVAIWQQNHPGSPGAPSVVNNAAPAAGSHPDELLLWNNAPRVESLAPSESERVLVSQHNDGVVTGADGQPKWKLRQKFLNRAVWEDPETGEKHRMEVPEEREVLVPVHHD